MNSDYTDLILVVAGVVFLVALIFQIFFLRTVQRVLQRCAPQNRAMSPGQVWLSLVPIINVVWQFIQVSRVADTLQREYAARQIQSKDEGFGRGIGMTMCAMSLAGIIPFLGVILVLVAFICWIVYWSKMAGYGRVLDATAGSPLAGVMPGPYLSPYPPTAMPQPAGFSPGAFPPPPPFPPGVSPAGALHAAVVEDAYGAAWPVLIVLMLGMGAGYLARVAFNVGLSSLQSGLYLSSTQIGTAFAATTYGMIAGYLVMTAVTALAGSRWGFFIALVGAALSTVGSGFTQDHTAMILARGAVGFFCGGLLPAAVQAIREWFPTFQRPFALGMVFASGQVASLLTPLGLVPLLRQFGWRNSLMVSGAPLFLALVLCLFLWPSRTPRRLESPLSTGGILSTLALGLGLLLAAPVQMFATAYAPMILHSGIGERSTNSIAGAVAGIFGALLAGAMAWTMMESGVSPRKTRAGILTIAGFLLPLVAVSAASGVGLVVTAILGALAYQAWQTMLYSCVAETLPVRGVAIGAAVGALLASGGSMLSPIAIGRIMEMASPNTVFILIGVCGAVALFVVALLAWLVRTD
jgi:hypothetical protein